MSKSEAQIREELEDISEKDIMLEIMTELKSIRYGLQTGDFGTLDKDDAEDEANYYQCNQCRTEVKEDNRQEHLVSQHNAPAMISVEEEFTKL
jgi:hypothetical protein